MLNFNKRTESVRCDSFVHEIAELSAAAILSRLNAAAETMGIAELRGYARAHAWPLISAEVDRFAADSRLAETQANELLARALEQTVYLVTRAYTGAPIISMPAPHIGLRIAA